MTARHRSAVDRQRLSAAQATSRVRLQRLSMLELPLWTFLLMTVSLVVSSVFFGWLQQRSGSVWLPALGHSTNNTFEAPFSSVAFTGGTGNAWLPLGAALVLVAAESAVQLGAVLLGPRTLGGGERGTPVPSARAAAAATSAPLSARQEP